MAEKNQQATQQPPIDEVAAPKFTGKSRNKIAVACKLPHGIVMRLFRAEIVRTPVMGMGVIEETRHVEDTDVGRVVLAGNAVHPMRPPRHTIAKGADETPFTDGFAITMVDEDFWEEWKKQNHDLPALRNGLIYAAPTLERAVDMGNERTKLRSGLEPLTPDKDPRVGRTSNPNLSAIETEEERAKKARAAA